MNDYQQFIYKSRYAKWRDDLGRRENWEETVDRYIAFWLHRFPQMEDLLRQTLAPSLYRMEAMPSMRALMTAGPALDRDEIAGYNCSYLPIDHPRAFDEIMYILMCGTGVGYTVERDEVSKLPTISEEFHDTETEIVVADSRIGWASSFRELISLLYSGRVPKWSMERIRPAGARLRTFGGRASGPEPLEDLFRYCVALFKHCRGRKLNSLECHDLVCKIADIVVVGGVRRSALICLSNLTDERLRTAKSGQWWETNAQRALANISVAYTEKPDVNIFLKEWTNLYESKSGERGLYNRVAARKQRQRALQLRGKTDTDWNYGTNPCGEIILRPNGLCNLSEVVVRPDDTFSELQRKVRCAAIFGTLQSTLTEFRYLRSAWRNNAREERLLGVSFTGIMDHPVLSGMVPVSSADNYGKEFGYGEFGAGDFTNLYQVLAALKKIAIDTNKEIADLLGIEPSNAVTCVKPSGTVSQLVGCSSGIHPSYSPYYIRAVRNDKKDPISQFLIDSGVPYEEDVHNKGAYVFNFPIQAPFNSVTKISAMEQFELYELYTEAWCEHNTSITIYYTDDEFLKLGATIYEDWDKFIGVSLLPKTEHVYKQAPYQPVEEETYQELLSKMPELDWSKLAQYESDDFTTASHELACVAGVCEI